MRRRLTIVCAGDVAGGSAGRGGGHPDGPVRDGRATFTFTGKYPSYQGERLVIAQGGKVLYDRPVISEFCRTRCGAALALAKRPSVQVVGLDGQPAVVLDFFSGGAQRVRSDFETRSDGTCVW